MPIMEEARKRGGELVSMMSVEENFSFWDDCIKKTTGTKIIKFEIVSETSEDVWKKLKHYKWNLYMTKKSWICLENKGKKRYGNTKYWSKIE